MSFCLGRPGLNPRTDLGFFQFRIAVNLFSLGVRLIHSKRPGKHHIKNLNDYSEKILKAGHWRPVVNIEPVGLSCNQVFSVICLLRVGKF